MESRKPRRKPRRSPPKTTSSRTATKRITGWNVRGRILTFKSNSAQSVRSIMRRMPKGPQQTKGDPLCCFTRGLTISDALIWLKVKISTSSMRPQCTRDRPLIFKIKLTEERGLNLISIKIIRASQHKVTIFLKSL